MAKPPKRAKRTSAALVAQLDRASDFESEGREFESLRARHFAPEHAAATPGCPFPRCRSGFYEKLHLRGVAAVDILGSATGRGEQLADGSLHSGFRCGSVTRGSTMEICMSVTAWLAFARALFRRARRGNWLTSFMKALSNVFAVPRLICGSASNERKRNASTRRRGRLASPT